MTQLCVLRISEENMFFILNDKVVHGGIWCQMNPSNFFEEYRMEGLSEESNEIYLEVTPDEIVQALKTGTHAAKSLKIKLTKKNSPCLTFEIELPSHSGRIQTFIHDVPVNVIPKRLWSDYKEPLVPQFDISVAMPPLKSLKTVTERLKNLGSYMELSANHHGDMRMRVETEQVTVSVNFKDLEVVHVVDNGSSQSQTQDRALGRFYGAKVDIKNLLMFLSGQLVNPSRIICNIVENSAIHCFLIQEDVSIQYCMPVINN